MFLLKDRVKEKARFFHANADRSAEQFRKMTETPIPKLILSLAAPTILSMLITSIYNLADTFFVGQISTSASGAVGIVSSLMAILQALGFMLGHGSGSIISRSWAARTPMLPPGLLPPASSRRWCSAVSSQWRACSPCPIL
mgnify:FL=1